MMGAEGLKRATQVALLNANYIAKKLAPHYPTLYSGRNGYVAHECILDLRPLKEASGVSAEDVAKRLIDYGFHVAVTHWDQATERQVRELASSGFPSFKAFMAYRGALLLEDRALLDLSLLSGRPATP